jgi:hypothetical protein
LPSTRSPVRPRSRGAEVAGRPDRLRAIDEVLADLWALRRVIVRQVQVEGDDYAPSSG